MSHSNQAIHPGIFIKEELEARNWNQKDLAFILGSPEQSITQIITGKRSITPEMAKALAIAFNVSPELFSNLQQMYDLSIAQKPDLGIEKRKIIQTSYPARDMIKRGWLTETKDPKNTGNIVPLFDSKKLDLLKSTICKGATDDEFELFLHACQRTGLDPFMRQIYAVKRWDSVSKRETMTIQTGIDGYRLIAERTGKYSPGREPTYQYDGEGRILSSTAYVKKQTSDGTWHEVAATAFFNEYCQKTKEGKPTRFWMQLGHAMIAKCAEALALRKAFPGDLSGIYTKEEMLQADSVDIPVDHIADANKMVQEQPKDDNPFITKDKWETLSSIISQCEESFQSTVWNRLESLGIRDYSEMDEKTFLKVKDACLKHQKEKNENTQPQTKV